MAALKSFFAC